MTSTHKKIEMDDGKEVCETTITNVEVATREDLEANKARLLKTIEEIDTRLKVFAS